MPKVLIVTLLLTAGVARAQDDPTPTPLVATAILSWGMQDDACVDGNSRACSARDRIQLYIKSQGWCPPDHGGDWHPCATPATISIPAGAQQAFPRFTLKQGQLDTDGFPTSGAKLCVLGRPDVCYQMPSSVAAVAPEVIYQFGLDPRSERLLLAAGNSWVFFSGTFSAGGSGSLERLAVLRYDGNSIINLMPLKTVTNLSDRAMWTVPNASPYPILVDADFIWSDGETHFEPHFYAVEAWLFDFKSDRYLRAFSYRTTRKYDDDMSKPHVLRAERQEILRRLEADTAK